MTRITRAHIVAARGRKRILERQNKDVPAKIAKLASLDPTRFPRSADSESHSRHTAAVTRRVGVDDVNYGVGENIDGRDPRAW